MLLMLIKIAIGLFGLGIVVLVHEWGHFVAARLNGIKVEAFSIGWGKPIFAWKRGDVEYRIGMFPAGGYCKMAGENDFEQAWKNEQQQIAPSKGGYFAAEPWRRMIVAFAGPLLNIIFAVVVFTIIWGIGFEYEAADNRIVLARDISGESYPADRAGLHTGDRIKAIDQKPVVSYRDIQRHIVVNAEKPLTLEVERSGRTMLFVIEPELQKDGAGRIGIYQYSEPVLKAVVPNSPAALAGLQSGDRILSVNGIELPHTAALNNILSKLEEPLVSLRLEYERAGARSTAEIALDENQTQPLGIQWQSNLFHTERYSLAGAMRKGAEETWLMFISTLRGFRLLFRGIDLTQSLSGPVRITWMAGEIATEGFGQSIADGLRSLGNFLALISIALGVTNLLPLPVLDGGIILISLIETVRRKSLSPKLLGAIQMAGIVIIAGLMFFALAGDILFFIRR